MDSSSTVTKIATPDESPMDSDVWDRMWEMGDAGALELLKTQFRIDDLDS